MAQVYVSTKVKASADAVWRAIRDFGGLDKFLHDVVNVTVEGQGVGAVRKLTFEDGMHIEERLESLDEKNRSLSYSIVSSPLPIDNYLSTMTVREVGSHEAEVQWSSTFNATGTTEDEAEAMVEGVYRSGFEGLKRLFGE